MFDNEEGYTSTEIEHIKVEMEAYGLSIVEIKRKMEHGIWLLAHPTTVESQHIPK